ncbi:MAG TPA: hypothetical protein VHY55_10205 [Acidimicrobiia bacterium]|nr:hypothetical protein [Acidimicrobiia bacterium]
MENDRDDREAVDHEAERAEAEPVEGEEAEPEQTDGDAGDRPVDRFRRSAGGAVVAAGLLGLRDALEGRPEKEEVTIVNEAPAAPPRDLEVVIDFEHPERSVAVVRHPDDEEGEPER